MFYYMIKERIGDDMFGLEKLLRKVTLMLYDMHEAHQLCDSDPIVKNLLKIKKKHNISLSIVEILHGDHKLNRDIWRELSLNAANDFTHITLKKLKDKLNWLILSKHREFSKKELKVFASRIVWSVAIRYQKNINEDILIGYARDFTNEDLKKSQILNSNVVDQYFKLKKFQMRLDSL